MLRLTALAALAAAALTGCAADPAPIETTPAALSDAEAFAAAEETYRAYVDALNAVDLSNPSTFEPVYALTTGDVNADFRTSFSEMHANGWTVSGESVVRSLTPIERQSVSDVTLEACLDVTEVAVRDDSGTSVVEPDRADIQLVTAHLVEDGGWQINGLSSQDGQQACAG